MRRRRWCRAPLPRAPFFHVAQHCHSLRQVERNGAMVWAGDPMESALVEMARRLIGEHESEPRLDEMPFDANRKLHVRWRATSG